MNRVPLPDDALYGVVFSLALMERNWHEYIIEAENVLQLTDIYYRRDHQIIEH
jgi:hypothetical protein